MISIDRNATLPVQQQLTDQLRFLIATGRYQIGARLPSTRSLAAQLDLSYHTVRAAYQKLESEGLIEGRSGSGYVVRERSGVSRSDLMEEGAAIVQDALRRLVGMGMGTDEIEYLVQEQLAFVTSGHDERKLVFAAPAFELADLCATQLSQALRQSVEAAALDALDDHADADFIFTSFADVRTAMIRAPRADVRGVAVHLNAESLERIVRLMDDDTLGVVTRGDESIPILLQAIRVQSGFTGQMLAFSSKSSSADLAQLVDQASLVAYTPASRRALLPLLKTQTAHVAILPVISETSLEMLRQVVPA